MDYNQRFCRAISSAIETAEEAINLVASSCSQDYPATAARATEQLKQLADLRSVLMLELRTKEAERETARANLEKERQHSNR